MKTLYKSITIAILIFLTTLGCSRKKNSFIGRNYHALSTEYNKLYNGNLAFDRGKATLNDAYTENFWKLLPVERLEVDEDLIFRDAEDQNPDFAIAEEKAVLAIQKHGMNIGGSEKNPQIDEAYILLGKARYFDQRFIPALQAFNYILANYPSSDKINLVKIWRAKTNIRLDNNEQAISNLKNVILSPAISDQDKSEAYAAIAQAHLNMEQEDEALKSIKKAAVFTTNYNEEARYNYIAGQLYNHKKEIDSANLAFDKVITLNRKVPRAYHINARLEKIRNFNYEKDNAVALQEYLTAMEESRENRPFLDKIYYEIARFHTIENRDSLAEVYHNKSIRATKSDQYLNVLNYQTLAEKYFDLTEYKIAGAYYDSTLLNLKEKTRAYRDVFKKRANLQDVIEYEAIALANDSIIKLAGLTKPKQIAQIKTHITALKRADSLSKAKKEAEALLASSSSNNKQPYKPTTSSFNPNRSNNTFESRTQSARRTSSRSGSLDGFTPESSNLSNGRNSSFYFYNQNAVARGKNEFSRRWGNRKLQDNWRLNSQAGFTKQPEDTEAVKNEENVTDLADKSKYDVQTYLVQIPTKKTEIDSLAKDRNEANFQLGSIYKEKFLEYQLAKKKYVNVLNSNPENRLILPSKYSLHKVYELLGESNKSEALKNEIITQYPDSRYAEILKSDYDPDTDKSSPNAVYKTYFNLYKKQEFQKVITGLEVDIIKFEGDPIVSKFEMLKASAEGRLYGFEAYQKGINYVALKYANSEEGREANRISTEDLPKLSDKTLVNDKEENNFKIIYEFNSDDTALLSDFKTLLDKYLVIMNPKKFKSSIDIYNKNKTLLVVHGIRKYSYASRFSEILDTVFNSENKKDKQGRLIITLPRIEKEHLFTSSKNYTTIQRHKNIDDILTQQSK